MAADNERREVEILLNAQQANASIKDMAAGVALLNNQLSKMSADDPRRAQMERDFQVLGQRVGAARAQMRTYVQTEEEARAAAERLNAENQQVILNGQKVAASFNEMDKAAKKLEEQLHDLSADDPGRKKMLADYHALQERIEGVKKEMGSAKEESSVFTEALAFAGVTVGAEAVLDGMKELGAEIVNTTKEVADLRSSINTLTGATGKDLDGLTTSVLAVSRTFGKDFNEVLASSNTLSKQMGVSQQEALRLIQQGFLAGADAGGDFLDQVKEYAPQFKNAGYAADEFIGHISQASTQGIFSDKGADVVKEFGLRIREQTKSTSEAMQAAFGSDFTKEIFEGINNGTLTVEQALQRVGKEMDETQIPANQLQTVIADVFGGPGEDAGIDYLKSLKNVGKGIDELVDHTNAYTARQERLLASQHELAEAQNALTKEFEGGGSVLDTLTNKAMTVLYTLLASLGATFKELFQPVQDIWKSFGELAESMGWVSKEGTSAKSVGEMLGTVIHALLMPTRWLWGAIADVVKATVEWAKSSDNARGYLQLVALPVRTLFELLSNGPAYFSAFSAGADTAFGSIGRAWAKVKSGDFVGAKEEFFSLGKNVGEAYRKAFDEAVAKKSESAATSEAAGDDDPAKRKQGGDGQTDAAREKAAKDAQKAREAERKKRKAERDKADQEHLNDLKTWLKDEGALLDTRNVLAGVRDTQALNDAAQRREQERLKIMADATKKFEALTGQEVDYKEQVIAIVQERDLQLRELQTKFDAEYEKDRQKALDEKIRLNEAETEEALAQLQMQLAAKKLSQTDYDEMVYQARQASFDRELALVKQKYGAESAEYKKLNAEKLKDQAAHTTKTKGLDGDLAKFKKTISKAEEIMNSDNVKFLEDSLGKQTILYKAFQMARKTAAIGKIAVDVVQEVQGYWANSADFGPYGIVWAAIQSGIAVARAGMAMNTVAGYAKGGATGDGVVMQRPSAGSIWGAVGAATGMGIGTNGKLLDAQGLEVAGIVHKNEYVIPEWMRADPQVIQVESWLEARRQRGFVDGGPTTEGDTRPATTSARPAEPAPLTAQLVQVLASLDQRLQGVEQWATQLEVVNDLLGLDRELEKVKQVKRKGSIK